MKVVQLKNLVLLETRQSKKEAVVLAEIRVESTENNNLKIRNCVDFQRRVRQIHVVTFVCWPERRTLVGVN